MSEKLNIYMHVAENSGVGYYRQYLPAVTLRDTGMAEVRINDFRWGEGNHVEVTERVFFETCNWADLIVVGRMDSPEYYAKWGAAKEFFNIPIVLDTDDYVQHVRPTNPGYQGYHPGSDALIWNERALKQFDALTVSTENLREYYLRKNPRIYTLPNCLDIADYNKYQRQPSERIKMTFFCSGSHSEGFGLIIKPVYDILKKYKHVDFYYPDMYWRLFQNAPEEIKGQLKNLKWIPLKEWNKFLVENAFDISLAPLRDNFFNRGKSNLRFIEFSVAGTASVLSPVAPYLKMKEGVEGFFATEPQEWYNAIEKLLDKKTRDTIAANAKRMVDEKFDIVKNIHLWDNAYKEVYRKFHDFYGRKKTFISWDKGKYRELKPFY